MTQRAMLFFSIAACTAGMVLPSCAGESAIAPAAIVAPPDGTFAERLAAREVRRYFYVRTGRLLPIVEDAKAAPKGGLIVVTLASKERQTALELADHPGLTDLASLAPAGDHYMLKTIEHDGRSILLVSGGAPVGPLYAAYRLAEYWGVRFYMHGDVIPDTRIEPAMPELDETGNPLFDRRGIQPFHDFPEGPDWWNADDYKAILGQLPKLRMNFFGLHCYPEGGVGPEPLVWIGAREDAEDDGAVTFSYPARHFTTGNPTGAWGYQGMKTSDYTHGAASLYDHDHYGAEYMQGTHPWTDMAPDECNALFNRMGSRLDDVFGFARQLGVKTCIGTETPLTIPKPVRERLLKAGKNPDDPKVLQEVYAGLFSRIKHTHPLDYYWFWTPESWTWRGVKQQQIDATLTDLKAAIAAAEQVDASFTLATCGWVLGPQQDRALFDNVLPKRMPMSCINRQVGHAPVEPGFADVEGRPKWAIPWLEDDPAMISPQLWVGRMRKDAADAHAYGCTGLMGIHWRTRELGPNVAALAYAAWDQSGWNPAVAPKAITDFYTDWARTQFGEEAAQPIAELFARIDGNLPRPSDWVDGPGGIKPDTRPWAKVKDEYAFVDELADMLPLVKGTGNLERFHFWLNQFRYMRANAQVNCTWHRYNEAIATVKGQKDVQKQKRLARDMAVPIRRELVELVGQVYEYLLASVSTPGTMGNVTNWQQHIQPMLLDQPGEELADILGGPLPEGCEPSKAYRGERRIFVPTVRTCLIAGEGLSIRLVTLGDSFDPVLYWRALGSGEFSPVGWKNLQRGVYTFELPAEAVQDDLEYYIVAEYKLFSPQPDGTTAEGAGWLRFPPTAPELSQTVVVQPQK